MKRLLVILLGVISVCTLTARKIKIPAGKERVAASPVQSRSIATDSAWMLRAIAISNFDKPVESRSETFTVTNDTDFDVSSITVNLDYFHADGTKIHSRSMDIKCHIPAHDTRMVSIPSFDRQQSYRYSGSRIPPRRYARTFDVTIRLTRIVYIPDTPPEGQ